MPQARTREHIDYVAPDGAVYQFHVPSRVGRWIMSTTGLGMPPIEYMTERGPFQHGETVVDYFLRPRIVQLLIRQQFCSREDYWTGRAALINGIRPNRQLVPGGVAPGALRFTLGDGTRRYLDCHIESGPRFEPRTAGQWDEWAFAEVLRFVAYNPILYDATTQSLTFGIGSTPMFPYTFPVIFTSLESQLVFPFTFPMVFETFAGAESVTYSGTWLEYPTITITGPIADPAVTNTTTGESIALDYDVAAGEVVTITLTAGLKTVTNAGGTNLIGTVTPTSDLGTFHLAPDPEAPGGVNVLTASGSGTTLASSIMITWRNRYIGI